MFSRDRLPGRAEQCVQIMVTANTAPLCFHTHLFFSRLCKHTECDFYDICGALTASEMKEHCSKK